ncbi:MAG: hypothetical protein O7G87_14540 [bacterium]|nr:hypothetical protein [bacterium]
MTQHWQPEPQLLTSLDTAVPEILASQKENGQFGTEPWISTDQNVLLALATAWHFADSAHRGSERVLDAIVRGGYALIDAQDEDGMFTFRKKDHSTWGQTYMPWAYSRWIRTFQLVRDAMSEHDRGQWEDGLMLGYEGISKTEMGRVHNIPAHHAMGLFCAAKVFGRTDWKDQAQAFMREVVAAQSEYGWWAEHDGPVVSYNFVYVEAVGVYYAMSGDAEVLNALKRAAQYHAGCTYPDGSSVETVDGRNPYHEGVRLGNVGFCHTAEGRGFLLQQHAIYLQSSDRFDADYAAQMLLYGDGGPVVETAAGQERHVYEMGDRAKMVRHRPWFLGVSAFAGAPPQNRWGQDRQNFVSVFHDQVGLIVGGGNTKLQPLWSTFTVGNTDLLKHLPGDEDPDFGVREGLIHVPDKATIEGTEAVLGLGLTYGEEMCRVTLEPQGDQELRLVFEATANTGMPVEGHVVLMPKLGDRLQTTTGDAIPLGEPPFAWTVPGPGGGIEHNGWRLFLTSNARVVWPVLPHNPYRKDGAATIEEARLVVVLPFTKATIAHELRLFVI